jgi:hypothetical protein
MKALWLLTVACIPGLVPLTGCSNNTGPTGATLGVTLSSPHSDDGAVLLTIAGGPVDSVEAIGYGVYTARAGTGTLRLIVTGDLGGGPIARIHVPDPRQAPFYTAKVVQVAARRTYAQRDPAAYGARLVQ